MCIQFTPVREVLEMIFRSSGMMRTSSSPDMQEISLTRRLVKQIEYGMNFLPFGIGFPGIEKFSSSSTLKMPNWLRQDYAHPFLERQAFSSTGWLVAILRLSR